MHYEYRIRQHYGGHRGQEELLAEMDKDGWELVCVAVMKYLTSPDVDFTFYFKRPLPPVVQFKP
jgi:hypothetical protein